MQARRVEEAQLRRVILAAGGKAAAPPVESDVPLHDLSAMELIGLLEAEIIAWRAAAAEYDRLGMPREAARLEAEAAIVGSYLAG